MPAELVNRVNAGLNQALQDADVKERLARLGIEPVGGTAQQFAAMTNADRAKWRKIITDRKLTPE
jgi:tripartite-type tricarboxylate transporter receptor subunit TctC